MNTYIIIASLLNFLNFTDFSLVHSDIETSPVSETYYLLTVGGIDTLTTPSGDKLTIIH
jgi:hypothetical protein